MPKHELAKQPRLAGCLQSMDGIHSPFHPRRAAQGGRGGFGEDCLSPRRGRVPQPPRSTEQRRAGGEGSPSFGSFSWGSKKRNARGGAEPSGQTSFHARVTREPAPSTTAKHHFRYMYMTSNNPYYPARLNWP